MLRRLIPGGARELRCPEGDSAGGAGSGAAGGAPNGDGDQNQSQKTVSIEDHQRALQDLHKFKEDSRKSKDALAALQNEVATLRTKGAEEKGDFKSLYEQKNQELIAERQKAQEFKTSVLATQKIQTLEGTLKKLGLKPGSESVMDFADLEKMPHELTSKGRILVHGADELAADLKKNYPFAFSAPPPPDFNGGGGGDNTLAGDSELTAEYMVELETKDPAKYKQLFPRYVEMVKKRQK